MADWKELLTFVDRYDVLARLLPACALLSPAVVPWVLLVGDTIPAWGAAAGGVVLLYALSLLVAGLGRRYQATLWTKQGGAPSTRLCRWADDRIERGEKVRLHEAVGTVFRIALHSARKEPHRPAEADKLIATAFGRVRELLRKRDPNGLWFRFLIEYGFARNCLAVVGVAAGLWLASAGCCAGVWLVAGGPLALAGAVAGVSLCSVSVLVRSRWRDAVVTHLGERYAHAAWTAFLSLGPPPGESNPPSAPKPSEAT